MNAERSSGEMDPKWSLRLRMWVIGWDGGSPTLCAVHPPFHPLGPHSLMFPNPWKETGLYPYTTKQRRQASKLTFTRVEKNNFQSKYNLVLFHFGKTNLDKNKFDLILERG